MANSEANSGSLLALANQHLSSQSYLKPKDFSWSLYLYESNAFIWRNAQSICDSWEKLSWRKTSPSRFSSTTNESILIKKHLFDSKVRFRRRAELIVDCQTGKKLPRHFLQNHPNPECPDSGPNMIQRRFLIQNAYFCS